MAAFINPPPPHHRRSRTTTLGETAIGDCYVGLVVSPGEMFTYPGSSQILSVDSNGNGRWSALPLPSFSSPVDFRVGSERFPQGDGTWIIDAAILAPPRPMKARPPSRRGPHNDRTPTHTDEGVLRVRPAPDS